jgi:hypothetical protein|eukprot:COSAG01_NODE_2159_length_8277_cov_416.997065_3_plen_77_part_00
MVARATIVTTHNPALAATTTWAVPKYPADSTDCLPSHMTYRHTDTQTHRHDTGLSHGPQSQASDTETCTGRFYHSS